MFQPNRFGARCGMLAARCLKGYLGDGHPSTSVQSQRNGSVRMGRFWAWSPICFFFFFLFASYTITHKTWFLYPVEATWTLHTGNSDSYENSFARLLQLFQNDIRALPMHLMLVAPSQSEGDDGLQHSASERARTDRRKSICPSSNETASPILLF
jgi:hypothetical protein